MIKIHKGREPQTLTEYRASIPKKDRKNRTVYDDFQHKTQEGCESREDGNLRRQLLEEQGHVCCYCLSRIGCKHSKIEHFMPREHRKLLISYTNLFLSCSGSSKGNFHCDTKKGEQELSSVDLLTHIEKRISYEKTGRIISNNQSLEKDINEILNLNCSILIENRKQTYSDLIGLMKEKRPKKTWSKSYLQEKLKKYKRKNKKGRHAPYYGMLIYFLQRRINRL